MGVLTSFAYHDEKIWRHICNNNFGTNSHIYKGGAWGFNYNMYSMLEQNFDEMAKRV